MTAEITDINTDFEKGIAFITIKGTSGDMKVMIEKIRKLEIW